MSSTYLTFLLLTFPDNVHSNEANVNSAIYALFRIPVLPYSCSDYANDGKMMKIKLL